MNLAARNIVPMHINILDIDIIMRIMHYLTENYWHVRTVNRKWLIAWRLREQLYPRITRKCSTKISYKIAVKVCEVLQDGNQFLEIIYRDELYEYCKYGLKSRVHITFSTYDNIKLSMICFFDNKRCYRTFRSEHPSTLLSGDNSAINWCRALFYILITKDFVSGDNSVENDVIIANKLFDLLDVINADKITE